MSFGYRESDVATISGGSSRSSATASRAQHRPAEPPRQPLAAATEVLHQGGGAAGSVRYPAVAALNGMIYTFGGQAITGPDAGAAVNVIQAVDPASPRPAPDPCSVAR